MAWNCAEVSACNYMPLTSVGTNESELLHCILLLGSFQVLWPWRPRMDLILSSLQARGEGGWRSSELRMGSVVSLKTHVLGSYWAAKHLEYLLGDVGEWIGDKYYYWGGLILNRSTVAVFSDGADIV